MQILLVEDDRSLASGLRHALHKQGYVVNHVESGEAALYVISTEPPDITILDLGLPDIDGIDVLKRLRKKNSSMPVLLLTARSAIEDKIAGLDSGADDYLAKPFEVTELFARLRVFERRISSVKTTEIVIGDVCLDAASHSVILSGDLLELPRKEYMVLKSLMENAGRVLTRSVLEARLYDWGEEVTSNTLEVHVHHLRKKLGADFIKTIRGVGYKIAKP
jgi:DNA-binding response OmpR family regulator